MRWYGHMSAVHEFHDKHHPDSNPKKLPGGQPIGAFAPRLAFGHRTYRFAPSQTTRASDEGFYPDPAPHALAPIGSDRLPSSLIVRPVVWIDQNGRKRVGCALIQRNAMAGVALPAATLRREGSTTIVQGEALMAWNPAWIAGKTKGCANITALEDPRCASGVFDHPADAAQAFVNLVFNNAYAGGVVPPGGAVP